MHTKRIRASPAGSAHASEMTCQSAFPVDHGSDAGCVCLPGRYHAALMQIQSVLTEVVTWQQLEKDNLALKYRSVSHPSLERSFV